MTSGFPLSRRYTQLYVHLGLSFFSATCKAYALLCRIPVKTFVPELQESRPLPRRKALRSLTGRTFVPGHPFIKGLLLCNASSVGPCFLWGTRARRKYTAAMTMFWIYVINYKYTGYYIGKSRKFSGFLSVYKRLSIAAFWISVGSPVIGECIAVLGVFQLVPVRVSRCRRMQLHGYWVHSAGHIWQVRIWKYMRDLHKLRRFHIYWIWNPLVL